MRTGSAPLPPPSPCQQTVLRYLAKRLSEAKASASVLQPKGIAALGPSLPPTIRFSQALLSAHICQKRVYSTLPQPSSVRKDPSELLIAACFSNLGYFDSSGAEEASDEQAGAGSASAAPCPRRGQSAPRGAHPLDRILLGNSARRPGTREFVRSRSGFQTWERSPFLRGVRASPGRSSRSARELRSTCSGRPPRAGDDARPVQACSWIPHLCHSLW